MRRSDQIAIAALAMVLVAITMTAWFANGGSLAAIDQGWATLVAAFFGFCAVAYQTRQGFRNLRAAAVEQGQADREAREHQAGLVRTSADEAAKRSAQTLAGALAAEITTCSSRIRNILPMLRLQQKIFEHFGESKILLPFEASSHVPKFDPLVYKANVGHLGMLGPSTAHDVVEVYNIILMKPTGILKDIPASYVAKIMEGYAVAYENWLIDADHVHKRLLAVFAGQPDPGALYQDRMARKSKP